MTHGQMTHQLHSKRLLSKQRLRERLTLRAAKLCTAVCDPHRCITQGACMHAELTPMPHRTCICMHIPTFTHTLIHMRTRTASTGLCFHRTDLH
mmetsp:Transcript_32093/g.67509  ORF Transcript_32093/g.67509 Transcript_32093/m.67509 type:complete len:94 (+) Transcript_32093:374-655(+)